MDDAIEVQNQSTAALSAEDDTVTLTESELQALHDLWVSDHPALAETRIAEIEAQWANVATRDVRDFYRERAIKALALFEAEP